MKKKTEEVVVYRVDPTSIKVSSMADNTPEMDDADYEALFLDIKEKGQLNPVLVYRGKIVDGRHRRKICAELGLKLKCTDLPYKLTLKRLEEILISAETRKNKTRSQKAIMAYRHAIRNETSQKDAAQKYGISAQEISMVKAVLAYPDGEEIVNILFSGKPAEIRIANGNRVYSKHLPTLLSALKERDEKKHNKNGSQELALLLEQSRINDRACSASLDAIIACHEIRVKELKSAKLKANTMGEDYIEQETADSKYGKDITE